VAALSCRRRTHAPRNTPGHAAAQWRLGNLLEKKKTSPGARAGLRASLKLDPNFTGAADALKETEVSPDFIFTQ